MHWNYTARLRYFVYHLVYYPKSFLAFHRKYWGEYRRLDNMMRLWERLGYIAVPPVDWEKE